jgi:hypothetical protein
MLLHILGKFRHLPVDGNGEVIAMQDIAKCLYDGRERSIARMVSEIKDEAGTWVAAGAKHLSQVVVLRISE